MSGSGPTFTHLGSSLGIRFGSERCSGRSPHLGVGGGGGEWGQLSGPRPPAPRESCGRKRTCGGGPGSPSNPGCAHSEPPRPALPCLCKLRAPVPGTWAPAVAAARARALGDPAPAQHFIPRVACCRSHRFPTCARALRPPRLCPRALQDDGVGGPRAGRGIHEALTFTSNANSAYLIPAAPPLLSAPARPFRPGGRKHSGPNSTCPESSGQFPFRSATAAASREAFSDRQAQLPWVRRQGAAG